VSSEETLAQAFVRLDSQQVRDFDQGSMLSSLLDSASETQSIRSLKSVEIETSHREPEFTRETSNISDDIYLDNDDESQLIKASSPGLEGVDMFQNLDLEEEGTNSTTTTM
jgi:hypothetical protein